jgi:hypothetical protein
MVSNEEKATELTNGNLEKLKKAGDRMAYLKEKMYYPQEVDDIFLNEDTNIFDIESAKRQKTRLLAQERTGTPVYLYDDGSGGTCTSSVDEFEWSFKERDCIENAYVLISLSDEGNSMD